jgi:hypothetical protein
MGYLQLCHVSLPEDIVWYCSVNRSIIQWIGSRENLTAKPNDLHGKIDGFRLRLSQKKQSIDYGNKDCQNMGIYQVCSPMFSAAT